MRRNTPLDFRIPGQVTSAIRAFRPAGRQRGSPWRSRTSTRLQSSPQKCRLKTGLPLPSTRSFPHPRRLQTLTLGRTPLQGNLLSHLSSVSAVQFADSSGSGSCREGEAPLTLFTELCFPTTTPTWASLSSNCETVQPTHCSGRASAILNCSTVLAAKRTGSVTTAHVSHSASVRVSAVDAGRSRSLVLWIQRARQYQLVATLLLSPPRCWGLPTGPLMPDTWKVFCVALTTQTIAPPAKHSKCFPRWPSTSVILQ